MILYNCDLVPERVPRPDEAHEKSAEEAAAALAHAEEERAHDPHHARHRLRRRYLGDVGHGRGHHQGHRQALQGLERVHVLVDRLLQRSEWTSLITILDLVTVEKI